MPAPVQLLWSRLSAEIPVIVVGVLVALAALLAPLPTRAQGSGWVDLGMGFGAAGEGGGVMGRAALGLSVGGWAAGLRLMEQNGGENRDYGGFLGYPSEEFSMYDLLVYRVLSRNEAGVWRAGLGVGAMSGKKIDDGAGLALFSDLDTTIGLPYELIYRSGDGRGFGWALHLSGHLNGEVRQTGFGVSVTLGFGSSPATGDSVRMEGSTTSTGSRTPPGLPRR